MRLTAPRLLTVLACFALLLPAATSAQAATSQRWVLGYYVGYLKAAMPPSEIEWSAMTHIVVGPVVPHADGSLDTTLDIDAVNGPALAKKLAKQATAHGVTPMLMIGGAGAHDDFLTAARDHRATLEKNLRHVMSSWGYAGLDLDWEPVNDVDQPVLLKLVKDLRSQVPGIVLTVPVGWVNPNFETVPPFYAQLATKVDRIDVMSYGMAGTYEGWKSWHSSALHGSTAATPSSVDTSIQLYEAAGVPAAKLGAGVGFYGLCYSSPVTGPSQALGGSQIVADDNVMSYTNIMASYWTAGAAHYDSTAEAPYLSWASPHGPQSCTYVSYEDARSVTAKGQWAQSQGLGALIVWNINEGHDSSAHAGHRDALLATVRSSFGA